MSDGRLSKKELAVVTEIVGFLYENGFPPTVRELFDCWDIVPRQRFIII